MTTATCRWCGQPETSAPLYEISGGPQQGFIVCYECILAPAEGLIAELPATQCGLRLVSRPPGMSEEDCRASWGDDSDFGSGVFAGQPGRKP